MPHYGGSDSTPPPDVSTIPPDVRIAALARRRHGVISRRQLIELGLGRKAIEYGTRIGRLHRVYPGVYAVGHPVLALKAQFMAA